MRSIKILFVAALVVYFLAVVIARTPATWGAWIAQSAVPGLSLSGVTGTVWDGRAAGAVIQVAGQPLDLGAVNWELKKLPLLWLNGCMELNSLRATGEVCQSVTGKLKVDQMLIDQLPASLLSNNIGVQVGGLANATVQRAVISDGKIQALEGNLVWQNARINYGDGWVAIGSFGANLSPNEAGGINAAITDTEGPFAVDLRGEFVVGQVPRLDGTVTPRDNAPEPLKNALSIFAQPQDGGAFRVTWPGG